MTETAQQQSNELQPGTVINGYRIERELGRGAMAIVYLATQLDLGRPVAFKVLSAELAADGEFVSRFFNEARAAAALSHPNIIQAIDAGQTSDGLYFFCMEYVDGVTLLDIIKRDGRIPMAKALKWFQQIADALKYGWELHKFTHGDIKPENIMINRQGQAKLADFGLARVDGHDYSGNVVMLTPLYAPPELIRGQRFVDECRPDIYAFGASLYHALAGTPPFPGTEAKVVIQRQLNEALEPLNHRCLSIPQDLSDFVGSMLEKEMNSRLGSWEAVIAGLKSSLSAVTKKSVVIARDANSRQKAIPPMPSVPKKHGNPSMMIVTFIVLGVCFLSVLLVALLKRPARRSAPVAAPAVVEAPAMPAEQPAEATPAEAPAAVKEAPAQETVAAVKKAVESSDDDDEEDDEESAEEQSETAVQETKPAEPGEAAEAEVPADVAEAPKADEKAVESRIEPMDFVLPFGLSEEQEAFEQMLEVAFVWLDMTNSNAWQDDWCRSGAHFAQRVSAERERLQALQEKAADKAAVLFLKDDVLDSFAKLPGELAMNGAAIGKMNFTLGNETWRIIDMGTAGTCVSRVEVQRPGRKNQVSYTWKVLYERGVLSRICFQLVASGVKSLDEQSPFLGYFAMTGQVKTMASLLAAFPADEKKAGWSKLVGYESLRGNAKRERNAFGLWRDACAACAAGARAVVHQTTSELKEKYEQTAVYSKFRPVVDSMNERSRASGVEHQLKQLQAEIADMQAEEAASAPDAVLTAAMFARARYGELMRGGAERRWERQLAAAQKALAEKTTYHPGLGQSTPFVQSCAAPHNSVFNEVSRTWRLLEPAESTPRASHLKDDYAVNALKTLARLAVGDWPYADANKRTLTARELEKQDVQGHSKASSSSLYLAALHGRALLHQRLEGECEKADRLVSALLKPETSDHYVRGLGMELAYEQWLLSRRAEPPSGYPETFLNGRALLSFMRSSQGDKRFIAQHRRRLVYMFVSAALEAGRVDEAKLIFRRLKDDASAEECGFPASAPYLRKLVAEAEELLVEPTNLENTRKYLNPSDMSNNGELLRMRLAIYGENPVNGKCDEPLKKKLEECSVRGRLVEGDAVFDWILRRVAFELGAGRTKDALALCDWALALRGGSLFPYYARLLWLRAGVLQLAGLAGGLQDAVLLLDAATCVSEQERKMTRALAENSRKGDWSGACAFWHDWLAVTAQLGGGMADKAAWEKIRSDRWQSVTAEHALMSALRRQPVQEQKQ